MNVYSDKYTYRMSLQFGSCIYYLFQNTKAKPKAQLRNILSLYIKIRELDAKKINTEFPILTHCITVCSLCSLLLINVIVENRYYSSHATVWPPCRVFISSACNAIVCIIISHYTFSNSTAYIHIYRVHVMCVSDSE